MGEGDGLQDLVAGAIHVPVKGFFFVDQSETVTVSFRQGRKEAKGRGGTERELRRSLLEHVPGGEKEVRGT